MAKAKKEPKPDKPRPERAPPIPANRRIKNRPFPADRPGGIEELDGPIVVQRSAESRWPATRVELRTLESLKPYANNPRKHTADQIAKLAGAIEEWGFTVPLLIDEDGVLIAGHARLAAAQKLELERVPTMTAAGWTDAQKRAYVIADNQLALVSSWDEELLGKEFEALSGAAFDMDLLGFPDDEFAAMMGGDDSATPEPVERVELADRFLVPPFSVLNAREGWWQARRRAWLALGIESEVGRAENLLKFSKQAMTGYSETGESSFNGTSVFDPVVCEIAYRWFSPPGGVVLDPFAGGSVRGIVAGQLGRRYLGIELRPEQVAANRAQARKSITAQREPDGIPPSPPVLDPAALTPVEQRGDIWIKRDDLFDCNGARGGKARACLALLKGAKGAVGAGNRLSPMLSRVARVAEHLGIPCRGHAAGSNSLSAEEQDAKDHGAELVKVQGVNYLTAVKARARKDAEARGWVFVPFGLESPEYFEQTKAQVANIPTGIKRIVVTAGSGMTVSAICAGLRELGRRDPILAVRVGLDPTELMDRWAPADWRDQITIVTAPTTFEVAEPHTRWFGVDLDPHYEAKAARYVEPGDLFWDIAIRSEREVAEVAAAAPDAPDMPDAPDAEPASAAPADPAAYAFAPVEVALSGSEEPAWARGFDVPALKNLAALYKAQDEPFVQGAFTGTKENTLAEALADGSLRGAFLPDGKLVAMLQRSEPKARGTVNDFADRACGSIAPGDVQLRRLACEAGHEAALTGLINAACGDAARCWLEIWQESPAHRAAAEAAGFAWISSKVRASSEIVGIWTRGGEIKDGPAPPEECAALVPLTLPELPTEALAARITAGDLPAFADHYSTYNKGHSWSALALRGYGGDPEFIIKPSEMSKQWRAENPEAAKLKLADTPLFDQLPEARALADMIPGRKHRVRLMKLEPNDGELTRHADITDEDAGVSPGRLLRIHIPIITNPQVEFTQWMLDGSMRTAHMPARSAWYLDTRKPHRAINGGTTARVHLVLDVESCPELLALLPPESAAPAPLPQAEPRTFLPPPDPILPEWIEGDSRNIPDLLPADQLADFVFSCPPYADLERYSDDARDLSTMDYPAFRDAYREIIAKACARLRPDRFACFVIGEVRDKRGGYYNFVGDTIAAFRDAGLTYYNEAILVTMVGSLALRAGKMFTASRKLGKAHQNILVFCKGDPRKAVAACGPVDVALPEGMPETEQLQ